MSLRFSLAKAAGAVSTWGLRHVARRPAANLPGKIALAIDPSLLDELRGHVVTCDEIGCGVVPIERNDENWREAVGRLCCALAEQADAVIRVWAGVPQFIKGELK